MKDKCLRRLQAIWWPHPPIDLPRKAELKSSHRLPAFRVQGPQLPSREQWLAAKPGKNMPYLVHVLFKQYYLSNVDAQNQSLFKQCNLSNVKNSKSGNISKSGNEVLKNFEFNKIIFDTKNYQSW